MYTSVLLQNISADEINSRFEDIQLQLREIKENQGPKLPDEYLTRAEVANMLKCDLSTIHHWVKKGKLKPYGIGNRVYFKRTEITDALTPLK